ncbi:MAG: gliding motility protein GldN [Tannerella sp.]|jgi:gliding motility associated protien GldN|nr:gliding motility protein GldN [Tannerella sp.]
MKRLNLAFLLIALAIVVQAQTTRPAVSRASDRATQQQDEKNLTELTVRAQIMNEQLTQEIGNARWIRNIIRELDLTKEKNAPLYYPVQEMNGMKNLFTSIFQLMSESKVNIYKYLADYESFDDENIMTFREFLEKFNVYFEFLPAAAGRPARFVINASDIPSREVTKLYVKEAWYFDQNNSLFDVKTLAICPIADLIMETGEQLSSGMFWVKYEDISPYIKSNYIMTSSLNNAKTYTMDDFFRRRMYDGAIIQTENLMNMPLVKLFETDEEIAAEQQRIEGELAAFEKALWFQPDSAALTNASNKKTSGRTAKATAVKKEKAPAQPKAVSASSSGSSSSGTTRSIRR